MAYCYRVYHRSYIEFSQKLHWERFQEQRTQILMIIIMTNKLYSTNKIILVENNK